MDANEDKLKAYYEMFPERRFGIRLQYDSIRHTSFLWDYMQINNYNCIPTEIGDIWINEADI